MSPVDRASSTVGLARGLLVVLLLAGCAGGRLGGGGDGAAGVGGAGGAGAGSDGQAGTGGFGVADVPPPDGSDDVTEGGPSTGDGPSDAGSVEMGIGEGGGGTGGTGGGGTGGTGGGGTGGTGGGGTGGTGAGGGGTGAGGTGGACPTDTTDAFGSTTDGWTAWGDPGYGVTWTAAGSSGGGALVSGNSAGSTNADAGMAKTFTITPGKMVLSYRYRVTSTNGKQFHWSSLLKVTDAAETTTLYSERLVGLTNITYCADSTGTYRTPYQYCTGDGECSTAPYDTCKNTGGFVYPADTGWRTYSKDLSASVAGKSSVKVILYLQDFGDGLDAANQNVFDEVRVASCP